MKVTKELLEDIKRKAHVDYMNRPPMLGDDNFLTECFLRAISDVMNKNGSNLNLEWPQQLDDDQEFEIQ